MKKQKICIIGGSLAALTTAISLSKLKCDIDLITGPKDIDLKSSRTLALSESNLNYLKQLGVLGTSDKIFWPCSAMKLYTGNRNNEFSKIFEINNDLKKEKILYMFENKKILKKLMEKIKKIKIISVKNNEKVSEN